MTGMELLCTGFGLTVGMIAGVFLQAWDADEEQRRLRRKVAEQDAELRRIKGYEPFVNLARPGAGRIGWR